MRNTVNVGSKRNLLIHFGGMKCRSEENVKKWRFRTGELILKACSIYVHGIESEMERSGAYIFRRQFGFTGKQMKEITSYKTAGIVLKPLAGNGLSPPNKIQKHEA